MTDIETAIKHGHDVADAAEIDRQDLRWNVKPGDPDRQETINYHLERIRLAMAPIRQWVGRALWGQVTPRDEARLREVSEVLQYNRKQLKKMSR